MAQQERLSDEDLSNEDRKKRGLYATLLVNTLEKQGPGISEMIQIFLGTSGRERWLLNHGIRQVLVTPTVDPSIKAQLLGTFVNSSPDPSWFRHAVQVLKRTLDTGQNTPPLRSAIATFFSLQMIAAAQQEQRRVGSNITG